MVRRPASRGFTLTELLAVLAILSVLAAVAAPSFSAMVGTMRARATSTDLYASLSRARSEAVKRNAQVTLQPNGPWGSGWYILDPANGSKLDDHPAVPNGTINGPASVVFLPNGRVKGGGAPSFDIAIAGQSQHRCVSLDLSGRPNQSSTGCTP
jgi:type IV fimbrial biogenesis protein FimT